MYLRISPQSLPSSMHTILHFLSPKYPISSIPINFCIPKKNVLQLVIPQIVSVLESYKPLVCKRLFSDGIVRPYGRFSDHSIATIADSSCYRRIRKIFTVFTPTDRTELHLAFE